MNLKNSCQNFGKNLSDILFIKKRIIFVFLGTLGIAILIFFSISYYFNHTQIVPASKGKFIEGIIGQPRFINPLYIDNDIDRDLVELLFSGLFSYNENGIVVEDLVKSYEILENGKVYKFQLKDNIFWHDGEKITADDVIFTIEAAQNPDYKSALITAWYGVKAEKNSEKSFTIELKNPYASFLENCTIKILPKHIWEKISSDKIPLTLATFPSNLLVGSGPFKFQELKFTENSTKLESIILKRNTNYFFNPSYFSQIIFKFFSQEKDLIRAINSSEIDGTAFLAPFNGKLFKNNEYNLTSLVLPRYFALFFNLQKSKVLSGKEVRKSLKTAVNKEAIKEKIFQNEAEIINSAILNKFFNLNPPSKNYEFNLQEASVLLEKTGFKLTENGKREKIAREKISFEFKKYLKLGSKGKDVENLQNCLSLLPEIYPGGEITGYFGKKTKTAVIRFQEKYVQGNADGVIGIKTREILNKVCCIEKETLALSFSITTLENSTLLEVANLLKNQWEKIGADVEIKAYSLSELKKIIKERDYESLLFGEILGLIPDPFPFWHSTQKSPGSNLSNYENEKADTLLTEIRKTSDSSERKEKLEKLQDIIIEDVPAIFLYNPNYYHLLSNKIKGNSEQFKISDPSRRFLNIEQWYIETKRVWK